MNAVLVESPAAALVGQPGPTISEDSVIASLCRDTCHDQFLLGLAAESEIVAAVQASVHDLWAESKVKNFIGVLALRDVRGVFGGQSSSSAGPAQAAVSRPANLRRQSDDDVLTLSDDGTID